MIWEKKVCFAFETFFKILNATACAARNLEAMQDNSKTIASSAFFSWGGGGNLFNCKKTADIT